jgi:hypothetical protein
MRIKRLFLALLLTVGMIVGYGHAFHEVHSWRLACHDRAPDPSPTP